MFQSKGITNPKTTLNFRILFCVCVRVRHDCIQSTSLFSLSLSSSFPPHSTVCVCMCVEIRIIPPFPLFIKANGGMDSKGGKGEICRWTFL